MVAGLAMTGFGLRSPLSVALDSDTVAFPCVLTVEPSIAFLARNGDTRINNANALERTASPAQLPGTARVEPTLRVTAATLKLL